MGKLLSLDDQADEITFYDRKLKSFDKQVKVKPEKHRLDQTILDFDFSEKDCRVRE